MEGESRIDQDNNFCDSIHKKELLELMCLTFGLLVFIISGLSLLWLIKRK